MQQEFLGHKKKAPGLFMNFYLQEKDDKTTPATVFLATTYSVLSPKEIVTEIRKQCLLALNNSSANLGKSPLFIREGYDNEMLEDVLSGDYDDMFLQRHQNNLVDMALKPNIIYFELSAGTEEFPNNINDQSAFKYAYNNLITEVGIRLSLRSNGNLPSKSTIDMLIRENANYTNSLFIKPQAYKQKQIKNIIDQIYQTKIHKHAFDITNLIAQDHMMNMLDSLLDDFENPVEVIGQSETEIGLGYILLEDYQLPVLFIRN